MTTTAPPTQDRTEATAGDAARVRRAVIALARREGARLLRHPAFLSLTALSLFSMVMFVGGHRSLWDIDYVGLLVFPAAGGTLIASNLAMLRGRRHDAEDLYAAAPLTMRARTAAHLLSSLWAVVAVFLLVVARLATLAIGAGAIGRPSIGALLVPPVLVAGAGAIGVMLARWIPSSLVTVPALFVIGFVEVQILNIGPDSNHLRWLAPWNDGGLVDLIWPRPLLWHVAYLVGLTGILASVALLRDRPRRPIAGMVAASIVVATIAGIAQVQQPDAVALARAAAVIERPESVQRCSVHGSVTLCYFPRYHAWAPRWSEHLRRVLSAAPASVPDRRLVVRQRLRPSIREDAPPILAARLKPVPIEPTGRPIDGFYIGIDLWDATGPQAQLAFAMATAVWAVGLPTTARHVEMSSEDVRRALEDPFKEPPHGDDVNPRVRDVSCDAGGQARAVVAVWLAAQSAPAVASYLRYGVRLVEGGDEPDDGVAFSNGPDGMFDPARDATVSIVTPDGATSPIILRLSDLRYALKLIERSPAEVRATMHRHWARFMDPSTSSDAVVRAFGLAPLSLLPQDPAPWEPDCA